MLLTEIPSDSDSDESTIHPEPSDEDSIIESNLEDQQTTEKSKSEDSGDSPRNNHLPTPDPSEQSLSGAATPYSYEDSDYDEDTIVLQPPPIEARSQGVPIPTSRPQSPIVPPQGAETKNQKIQNAPNDVPETKTRASKAEKVSTELDVSHIVPEGVKRTRKPSRRQAYIAAIDQAKQSDAVFHATFSALIPAIKYYTLDNPKVETKHHSDNIPIEPQYYHQMLKHPHAEGFKHAIKTEIDALQKKKT